MQWLLFVAQEEKRQGYVAAVWHASFRHRRDEQRLVVVVVRCSSQGGARQALDWGRTRNGAILEVTRIVHVVVLLVDNHVPPHEPLALVVVLLLLVVAVVAAGSGS